MLTIHQSHVELNIKGVCDIVVIDGSYVHLESNNANREIINGDHNNVVFVPYASLTVNDDYNKGVAAEVDTVTVRGDHNNYADLFDDDLEILSKAINDARANSDVGKLWARDGSADANVVRIPRG